MAYKLLTIFAIIYCVSGQKDDKKQSPPIEADGSSRQFPIFGLTNPQGHAGLPQYPPLGDQQPQQFHPIINNGPPFPYPKEYFPGIQQTQGYPPIQPQILYYQGNPGQPFLVNPGNPPGNFLVPQQPQPFDPNVFRNPQPYPQGPVFVAGYPKPAHIPPIEKDAEEIPQNTPKQGSPPTNNKEKPQKLEFDENETEPERKAFNPNTQFGNSVNLGPGHRFFVLNRQPLFSNYPNGIPDVGYQTDAVLNPYLHQFPHGGQSQSQEQRLQEENLKPFGPLANIVLRNQHHLVQQNLVSPQLQDHVPPKNADGLPITLRNQLVDNKFQTVILSSAKDNSLQSRYFEKGIPLDNEQPQRIPYFTNPLVAYDHYKYSEDALDDGSVIIDAKYQGVAHETANDEEGEAEKPAESSIAQAQPGAIALAGNGGVAAAGPRGTALAGEGGLAVSSPHATAVAGPSKDDGAVSSTTAAPESNNADKKKPKK